MSTARDWQEERQILREALLKLRLHGSPWWEERWGTPSSVANEALLEADLAPPSGSGQGNQDG